MPKRLGDMAKIVRSKNAGPFRLTFDIMFDDEVTYRQVVDSGVLNPSTVADLYGIPVDDVLVCTACDPALAIKITVRRPLPSGAVGDGDVLGAQQYVPLLDLVVEQ